MGCPREEAGPIPPRAGNVAMSSRTLAEALDEDTPLDPWPYNPEYIPTDRDWHHRRNGEGGSIDLLNRVLYRNPRRVIH
jgi:dTDP-4-dehydrorhamnose reductase